jgi:zinc transporter
MAERKSESLVFGSLIDEQGAGHEVWWPQIDAWKPDDGLLWLHFDRTAPETAHWLKNHSRVDPVVTDALLQQESRPRCLAVDSGLLVVLRGVNLNPGADPEDMVSLRLWIEGRRIITTRHSKVMAIQDLRDRVASRHGPKSAGDFLVQLAEALTARMAPTLDALGERVDKLEDAAPAAQGEGASAELARLRRQAIVIKRYLAPQCEAIARLETEEQEWLDATHRVRLHEIKDRVTRYVEDLDAIRDRTTVVQDELLNQLSLRLNKTMYLLSVVAAIILPPSFVAQIFGMSVGGIPGAVGSAGFWVIVVLLAILIAAELWFFRRLKWI